MYTGSRRSTRPSGRTASSFRVGLRSIINRGRLVDGSSRFSPFSSFRSKVSSDTPRRNIPADRMYSADLTFEEKVKLYVTCLVLVFGHMLSYADTYIVMSVSDDIEEFYSVTKFDIVILHTSFYLCYSLISPIVGFFGDRYNRKNIMIVGIIIWSAVNLGSSFVPPDFFSIFMATRIIVGIGQSIFCTLLPSFVSDLFVGKKRTRIICLIYLGIPIGGGLGYAGSGWIASITGSWQWSLRITCLFAFVCSVILKFVMVEPIRGQSDGAKVNRGNSTLRSDLLYLVKHKTFGLVALGFLYLCFSTGALKSWAPPFVHLLLLQSNPYVSMEETNYNMGVATCMSGVIGILVAYLIVIETRRYSDSGDPVVCSILMFGAGISTYLYFNWTTYLSLSWVFYIVTSMTIIMVMALTSDIMMFTVVPNRRSLATGLKNMIGHLLGNTPSPLVVGMAADLLEPGFKLKKIHQQIKSFQMSMTIPCLIFVCSALSYFIDYFFVEADIKSVLEWAMKESPSISSLKRGDNAPPKPSKGIFSSKANKV